MNIPPRRVDSTLQAGWSCRSSAGMTKGKSHIERTRCKKSTSMKRRIDWVQQRCLAIPRIATALATDNSHVAGLKIGSLNTGADQGELAMLNGLGCDVLAMQQSSVGPSKHESCKEELRELGAEAISGTIGTKDLRETRVARLGLGVMTIAFWPWRVLPARHLFSWERDPERETVDSERVLTTILTNGREKMIPPCIYMNPSGAGDEDQYRTLEGRTSATPDILTGDLSLRCLESRFAVRSDSHRHRFTAISNRAIRIARPKTVRIAVTALLGVSRWAPFVLPGSPN